MPTYEYRCPEGHEFEKFFRTISGAPTSVNCPTCGAIAVRQLSGGAGLLFKGSGFYLTDYGKNAHATKGPKAASPESGSNAGGSAGESKSSTEGSPASTPGSSGSGQPSTGGSSGSGPATGGSAGGGSAPSGGSSSSGSGSGGAGTGPASGGSGGGKSSRKE